MKVDYNLKKGILLIILLVTLFTLIGGPFIPEEKKYIYIVFYILTLYIIYAILYIAEFNFEKAIIILFFFCIPFMTELTLTDNVIIDYHVVAKQYYRFNYIHIFFIYFLFKILRNIKKIKFGKDLSFIVLFNIVCISGILNSLNPIAAFYDYIRYFILTIIYIFFSRVLDYKMYKVTIYKSLSLSLGFQLFVGIVQKVLGKGLGLKMLGEYGSIFRVGVSGYEKGFSGTFGHPGPMALYSTILLAIFLFNGRMENKVVRIIGIVVSSLITLLAAGRTSIMIMIFIYTLYFASNMKSFNVKKLIIYFMTITVTFIVGILFMKPVLARFVSSDALMQIQNRLRHVMVGIEYIKEKPLIGIGLNNFLDYTYRDYGSSIFDYFSLSNPIHNVYVQYLVEVGVSGLLLLMLFFISLFVLYFKLDKNKRVEIKGCLIVILVWLIYGFQGWGGIQTRSLLLLLLSCSVISNRYYIKNLT